jgi:integrase
MERAVKLTKRVIDALPLPEGKSSRRFYYDCDLAGFGIMVRSSGRKVFVVQYGPSRARKRMALGPYGPLTPDAARAMAREILGKVVAGNDPLAEREKARGVPTFQEWAESYMVEVERRKKEIRKDRYFLLTVSIPRLGGKRLDEITVEDVRRLFEAITARGTRIQANRWLGSIRACLQAAWREDKIPTNPAMKVKPNPENPPRDRVLSDDELRRLLAAVDALPDVHVRAAFALLIETGARLSEVLRAEWSHFDLDQGIWRMPKTKSGRPQFLPLAPSTVATLASLPRRGRFVVEGRAPDRPRTDLKRPWELIQQRADILDVHMHDLRRTFGLHIARRSGLHVASRLLRHSDIRVTERVYAPLGFAELREAMEGREADILPFRGKAGGE